MLEEKKYVEIGKDYTFYKIFGLIVNISYYLFFPLYYIDFNIGVMYFYSSTFYINNKNVNYLPLNYNLTVLKFFDSMNQIFLMILYFLLTVCLSIIYPYYRKMHLN